jgi:hypothetical protein
MKERWLPVGLLAVGLFVINVAGRVAAKIWADGNDDKEIRIGLIALAVIGVVVLGTTVYWVRAARSRGCVPISPSPLARRASRAC